MLLLLLLGQTLLLIDGVSLPDVEGANKRTHIGIETGMRRARGALCLVTQRVRGADIR